LHRRPIRETRNAGHAAHTIYDQIVSCAIATRTSLPEAGDTAENHGWISLKHSLVAEPEAIYHAGGKVLHHHIRLVDQLPERFLTELAFEIEFNRALVPVHAHK